jgi:MFS family permease
MFRELTELWQIRQFRRLFTARVISNIGNGMTPIALAFGVLSLKGADAGSLSYVTTAQMVPLVLFLIVGGVAADRFGRSQLVGITDIIGGVVVAISAIAFLSHHASIPLLCVNGFIFGVLNALWYPAFSGLMPLIVPEAQLQSANSLLGVGANLGFTLGASVAGIIVSSAGSGWAILCDALSFIVAGFLVFALHLPKGMDNDSTTERVPIFQQLREGWFEFSSRRWIVIVVVCYAFYNMAFEGFLGVLAPVQSKEALHGATDLGYMMLAFGVGGVLGMGVAIKWRPTHPLLIAVAILPAAGIWMLSLAVPLPLLVLMLAACATGISMDLFYALWLTALHMHVPQDALSRVGSYDAFGSLVFAPVGLFLAGPLTHLIGAKSALLSVGVFALATCLIPLLSHEVRTLKSGPSPVHRQE